MGVLEQAHRDFAERGVIVLGVNQMEAVSVVIVNGNGGGCSCPRPTSRPLRMVFVSRTGS
ncbi:MAG: hypothetical protein M1546_21695 [Chloroflexi bacterium]|nr:hypothetical protein [Chloroflexota bacterium]